MPLSPCHQLAKDQKATIDARMMGRKAQNISHKGRSVAYAETPTKELIAYYNQVRAACPDALADAELIELTPLDGPQGRRGPPSKFFGRGHV
jgi:hypothetical protein